MVDKATESSKGNRKLSLKSSRKIIAEMSLHADTLIIGACRVIEEDGDSSEKLGCRALRQVFESYERTEHPCDVM